MLSFGIDYTNQRSVGLPIENAKFGFASKFGFSADIKYKTITESLYYYYREEILTGKYSLVIPAQMLDDPEQIIINLSCSDNNWPACSETNSLSRCA